MSADNGLLLWRKEDVYVVSEYNASTEYEHPSEMYEITEKKTIGEAVAEAQSYMEENVVEYGLSIDLSV